MLSRRANPSPKTRVPAAACRTPDSGSTRPRAGRTHTPHTSPAADAAATAYSPPVAVPDTVDTTRASPLPGHTRTPGRATFPSPANPVTTRSIFPPPSTAPQSEPTPTTPRERMSIVPWASSLTGSAPAIACGTCRADQCTPRPAVQPRQFPVSVVRFRHGR